MFQNRDSMGTPSLEVNGERVETSNVQKKGSAENAKSNSFSGSSSSSSSSSANARVMSNKFKERCTPSLNGRRRRRCAVCSSEKNLLHLLQEMLLPRKRSR